MKNHINLTEELMQLLFFTGETATAIRLYSCYAREFNSEFTAQDSRDLLVLSDTLHYFSSLANSIEISKRNGEYSNLIFQCKKIIDIYSKYEKRIDPPNNKKFNLNATFSNNHNNSLCDYTVALKALNSIIQKCENL